MRAAFSLQDVKKLAESYIPPHAIWDSHLDESWGPAHELSHFLIARPKDVRKPDYGLDPPLRIRTDPRHYPGFKSRVYEMAATVLHSWILVACDEEGVRAARFTWLDPDEDLPHYLAKKTYVGLKPPAYSLLAARGITRRGVQTLEGLEGLCQRAREALS